ncbi:MAG: nitroreductase family protein [Candidatus Dadabacteria bacterium]|nr:nitroreductase family protein [Candidatus Dadabacteria bacterium]
MTQNKNVYDIDVYEHRMPEYDVPKIIVRRWSPRAMSGEKIKKQDLMTMLEAARWAPSSYNNQPWRFIYALRDTEHWDKFMELLVEGNRAWALNAAALVVIASKTTFDYNGKPSITHAFDTGAAWGNFALVGSMYGLVVHGMQGFDYNRARVVLNIPDDIEVLAMAAVGKPGRIEDLPESLREKEYPSSRKSLSKIAFEGGF